MSGFYTIGKEGLLSRVIPEDAGVYCVGVNGDYVFDSSHADPAVFAPYIVLPEAELQNCSFDGGVLDADDYKWIAAGAGVVDRSLTLTGVVIYFQKDDVGTLLAYINAAVVGLPQLLTGVNVTAFWDARGILKL